MSDVDREKFKILLDYWVRHNREHSEDLIKWAKKARGIGEIEVSEDILEAKRMMDSVNTPLIRAMERLKDKETDKRSKEA